MPHSTDNDIRTIFPIKKKSKLSAQKERQVFLLFLISCFIFQKHIVSYVVICNMEYISFLKGFKCHRSYLCFEIALKTPLLYHWKEFQKQLNVLKFPAAKHHRKETSHLSLPSSQFRNGCIRVQNPSKFPLSSSISSKRQRSKFWKQSRFNWKCGF